MTGVDENGEVRVVELHTHPFFLATLFLPQLSSSPAAPHPLFVAFVEAAAAFRATQASPSGETGTGRLDEARRSEGRLRGGTSGDL